DPAQLLTRDAAFAQLLGEPRLAGARLREERQPPLACLHASHRLTSSVQANARSAFWPCASLIMRLLRERTRLEQSERNAVRQSAESFSARTGLRSACRSRCRRTAAAVRLAHRGSSVPRQWP